MGLTHHSGKVRGITHKVRTRQIRPTDPTPIAGDWYMDVNAAKLYVHDGSMWWATVVGTSTSTTATSTVWHSV